MNISFKVVNVVSTAALSHTVDIESLTQNFPNEVVHDEEIYGGRVAYFTSEVMQGKVTIFPSGKIISVGTRSIEDAVRELNLVAKALKANLNTEPRVRNIVATVDFGEAIDLEEVSDRLGALYEPEQFPGAILRVEEPGTTALLFASGKAVILGAREIEDLNRTVVILSALLNTNATMENSSNRTGYRPRPPVHIASTCEMNRPRI